MNDRFSYDELPYPSFTFAQTHPDRLATMGTFYGMEPAEPEKCRVLELGCGDGANLLSMAYSLPKSEFVGVDLSDVHIRDAQAAATKLSLANAEFTKADVTQLDPELLGQFDYIIAHGLFSWVPGPVRASILDIYGKCLAPNGVGYISYNAYPGCRLRELCWDMMRFHTGDISDPRERVSRGLDFMRELSGAVESDSLYQTLLQLELEAMEERSVSNIFHDELATFNQPFYFQEFAKMIGDSGFQFLSEADPVSTNEEQLSTSGRRLLDSAGDDLLRREQYLDFIQARRFRCTLFCRSEIALDREPAPSMAKKFYLASSLTPEGPQAPASDQPQRFLGSKEASITINHPLTKAALTYLGGIWARRISFDELLAESVGLLGGRSELATEEEIERMSAYLVRLFQAGFVKFHRFSPRFVAGAGEFPRVSEFARWQIGRGSESVATLTGTSLKPEFDAVRAIIVLSDGTRDRKALAADLLEMLDVPADERERAEAEMPALIESNLEKMAASGLLHC